LAALAASAGSEDQPNSGYLGLNSVKKIALRLLLAVASLPIAYFVAMYAAASKGVPLGGGLAEGTPATMVAFIVGFLVTLVVVLVFGNILISRYLSR
jgi:hypothetical protein